MPVRPYVIIETKMTKGKKEVDVGYLVYGDQKLRLTPSEYAIAASLLSENGFDVIDFLEERGSMRGTKNCQDTIGLSLHLKMYFLRKKIKQAFDDELVVPERKAGPGQKLKGLRLWTREELLALDRKRENPGEGIVFIEDETCRIHLYIRGKEVRISGNGVSPLHKLIIARACSKTGFNPYSQDFQRDYGDFMNNELNHDSIPVVLSRIRNGFKIANAGVTLSRMPNRPGASLQDKRIFLIPAPTQSLK